MHPFINKPVFPPVIFQGRTYTNDELLPAIGSVSEIIKRHQAVNDSPFVYLFAENHVKTIIAWFAIMQADCSCVLMDPDFKPLDLDNILTDAPACAVIRFSRKSGNLDLSDDISLVPRNTNQNATQKRGYTIVYTAAEDGMPKGALLSAENLLANAGTSAQVNRATSQSRSLALLPFHHTFGLTMGILSPMISRSAIIIEDIKNIQSPSIIAHAIDNRKVTHLYSIPIMLYVLSRENDLAAKLASVEYVISGGYKLPEMVFDLYKKRYNIEVREGYGLTEASPICSWHYPDDRIVIESVGRYQHYCRMKVFSSSGKELPIGQPGEICVQGDSVMEGYLNRPEATAAALRDGWLHTGDLGRLDNEGYVYLTGLRKKMVHVGGRNVYPAEVERMLQRHPNVDHVALDWTDSPLVGARVNANIVLKKKAPEEQKAYMHWCIQQISAYKLPKQWEFR